MVSTVRNTSYPPYPSSSPAQEWRDLMPVRGRVVYNVRWSGRCMGIEQRVWCCGVGILWMGKGGI